MFIFFFKGHHGVILNPDGLSSNLTHYVANTAVPADDGSGGIVSVIPEPQPPSTYYFALMLGAWIVTPDWVKQSLDCGSFVDETEFEVLLLIFNHIFFPHMCKTNSQIQHS